MKTEITINEMLLSDWLDRAADRICEALGRYTALDAGPVTATINGVRNGIDNLAIQLEVTRAELEAERKAYETMVLKICENKEIHSALFAAGANPVNYDYNGGTRSNPRPNSMTQSEFIDRLVKAVVSYDKALRSYGVANSWKGRSLNNFEERIEILISIIGNATVRAAIKREVAKAAADKKKSNA